MATRIILTDGRSTIAVEVRADAETERALKHLREDGFYEVGRRVRVPFESEGQPRGLSSHSAHLRVA